MYMNDLSIIQVKTQNRKPKPRKKSKEEKFSNKIKDILETPTRMNKLTRQNSNHMYVNSFRGPETLKGPKQITHNTNAFVIEQPEPVIHVIEPEVVEPPPAEPEPVIEYVVEQTEQPLPPVFRKQETRVKFHYLRKRHQLSPQFQKDQNKKVAQIIKERGSASQVTIEKVLPNILPLKSLTIDAGAAHATTEPSTVQTINSSMSRAPGSGGSSSNILLGGYHNNNSLNMLAAVNDRVSRLDNQVSSLPLIGGSHRSSIERQ